VITVVHYVANVKEVFWHQIFQRAYYLPIIVAALWYGLRGGLLAAGLAAVLYLPHIVMAWREFPSYQFNQYSEVVLFFVFGGLTGALADQQGRQREKLQETAERLSQAYAALHVSFESLRRAERLSAMGRLSAGLAHEIRNPLSAIEGALEIVARPGLEPDRREEFAAIVKKELARLNEMLNHFLEFARPRPPQLKATNLQRLMEEVCSLVTESVSMRRVTTRCALLPSATAVSLDPDQIKEVLLNLVLNASEAMPAGGSIELWAAQNEDSVVINVRDEGTGVAEENLQQIFDPFYTTKPAGTGLGLSIAHRIMEQHGGKIEAKRNHDRGMTFSLVFPRERLELQ
jgi:signal transduction histidine kinase